QSTWLKLRRREPNEIGNIAPADWRRGLIVTGFDQMAYWSIGFPQIVRKCCGNPDAYDPSGSLLKQGYARRANSASSGRSNA
ncbi:MAG: hypothetical protein WCH39_30045, partial [Schlesneria sp.]